MTARGAGRFRERTSLQAARMNSVWGSVRSSGLHRDSAFGEERFVRAVLPAALSY